MTVPLRHFTLVVVLAAAFCPGKGYTQFKAPDQALYDTIIRLDSIFFAAYNTCNEHLAEYGAFYADSLEFYHDQGGLTTSKADVIEATKKNICGRVTRELIKGSVEVYPIANYGAIEIGYHIFRNNTNPPETVPKPGRFVLIWRNTNGIWKITRVISLH
jgi:hypothetical protein